jgi:autotransporter-associated beta strand protein
MIGRGTPMERKIPSQIKRLAAIVALAACACTVEAGSATWNLDPGDNLWQTAENWTPATVPNSESDTASFGVSDVNAITVSEYGPGPDGVETTVDKLVFEEGASSYTITVVPEETTWGVFFDIVGGGVINNSGVVQNIVVAASGDWRRSAWLNISNSASIDDNVVITNQGGASANGDSRYGASTAIGWDLGSTVNAGRATFINEGSTASGTIYGGFTNLEWYSSAESATFINNPGTVSGAAAGHTLIQLYAPGSIGNSSFINNAATVAGAEGGWTEIDGAISNGASFIANGANVADAQGGQVYTYGGDGYSFFIANGGNGSGAQGGLIDVLYVPASVQTVVTAKSGTNGGLGGTILIEDSADIPLPQFKVFGNGVLDLTNVTDQTMPIGSLAGNGMVLLAGHTLSVGNNNLSTTFAGIIQESGGLTKSGTGTLTLTGANTYSGPTTVTVGTLRVNNSTGSGTGSGPVKIQAGAVGGTGTISGPVTIGTGSGPGAVLAPSVQGRQLAILTLEQGLTFKGDGSYSYKLNTNSATADQVIAHRVDIQSGAQFTFQSLGNRRLPIGTTFIAIGNTAGTPISGTFANLPDGSTFTAGRNNYQASYEGGDGNDLTLTVVP